MNVELITRYAKLLIVFVLLWIFIWVWNIMGYRKVAGAEMEPTLKRDAWAWISPRKRDPEADLKRGDVIFYEYSIPTRKQQTEFVSRVTGLPGDRVRIVKGEVYVNGEKVQDALQPAHRGSEDFEEIVVPRDCVFVLCDNRKATKDIDSRGIGPVAKWAIRGKAR